MDLKGEILSGWNLLGTYAFTPDAEVTVGDPSQVGRRLNGVPRHGASLLSTYELQSGTLRGLKFGGGIIVRSSQETNPDSTSARLPGYATVNLLANRDRGKPHGFAHRVAGGGHPPPAPTERRMRISRTALFRG
ncbi:MAG: TonB-dependent receptor domain-containing protein [Gammaproteobacteria bacterium]